MLILLLSFALANPYEGRETDVVAEASLAVAPKRVFLHLSDIRRYGALYPSDCGVRFASTSDPNGEGAATQFVHKAGPLKRKITAYISKATSPRLIEIDHGGPRGFITRFTIEAVGAGSTVRMTSYQNMPPWPVRGIYFNKVQPAWQGCQQRILTKLQTSIATQKP